MEETETNWDGEPFAGYREELIRRAGEMKIDVTWARRPIRDLSVPSWEHMAGILDGIDGAIAAGRPVYVHCWGGKGRTGTVVGCYLARHAFASGERVLEMIRELRASVPGGGYDSPETGEQREMVRSWKIGE
jgi:protein-tyrosine phosphatase